jgi:hypothetical protein
MVVAQLGITLFETMQSVLCKGFEFGMDGARDFVMVNGAFGVHGNAKQRPVLNRVADLKASWSS